MTTVDVMTSRMAAGDSKEKAASFAYETLAFPMLTGSFVTAAGFVPIGFARCAAGEYTFSIFAVVTDRADRVLVRCGAVRAAARRRAAQEAPDRTRRKAERGSCAYSARILVGACAIAG